MRRCLVVVLVCSVVLFQLGVMKHIANANPVLDINVGTDKQLYNVGETVKISGNVTLDGVLKNDSLVAVEIDFPNGDPFLLRTVKTGNITGGYWRVQILDLYTCDDQGNPKTVFNRGSFFRVNLTIQNIDVITHHIHVAVYVQLSNNTPLEARYVYDADIEGGIVIERYPTFQLPSDTPTGEARVFACIFSDTPENMGTPYCPEKTATFYIETTTPPMPLQPEYFNVTFVLPVENCKRGPYTIYATTNYLIEVREDIKQFTVIGPVPIFTYSPQNPIVCQTVAFDGSSSYDVGGTITDWDWQFDDGTTARGVVVTHVFEVAGPLLVNLTVADDDGGYNSTTRYVNILEAWPMFHHNPSRWGNSTSASPVTNRTLWSREIGPSATSDLWMYSSVAIYPGTSANVVFVGSTNGTAYALDANSGTVIWKTTPSIGYKFYSSPAVAYGLVLIGSEDGHIYALNATNGQVKYSITTGGPVYSSPAASGDRVFAASRDKKVYAFYVNGTSLWVSNALDEAIDSSPAVAYGKVFVATWNGTVYALNGTTGIVIWRTNLTPGKQIYSSPVAAYNRVFIGSTDNKVYALDAENGGVLWNVTTGNEVDSSPAVAHGVVFVGSTDNNLYALNAATGASVWTIAIGSVNWSSPIIAEGKVFVGTTDGKIYALKEKTGETWWSYQTSGAIDSSPSVLNDTLYVCSKEGKLYAFYSQSHDIAVTNVAPSKALAKQSETVTIQVTLWNKGTFNEIGNVNLVAKYDGTIFYNHNVSLNRGDEIQFPIQWDTTGVPTGNYVIYVNVTLVPPVVDEDLSNNNGTCQIRVEITNIGITDLGTPGADQSSLTPAKKIVGKGYGVLINAAVRNKGNFTESNVQVTFCWSNSTHVNQTIGSVVIPELPANTSLTVGITWNASDVSYGNYTVSAYAWPVFAEVDTTDNFYVGGDVRVVIPGDVTSKTPGVPDGKVDMRDIGAVCDKFGARPSSPKWDPNVDINNDGVVNMRDIGIACQNFGKKET